jgi:hypothetical protein
MTMTARTTPSKRLPRFERAPKRAPRIRLTDRDRGLLYTLYHYRFLPTSLLVERHFGSATRGRNRLKLLYHHGYVDRTFPPTVGPSTGEAIYSLGPAAVPELVALYGLSPEEVRRKRGRVEPFFIAHQLLVGRFRLRLAYVGAPHGVGLRDWREERGAELRFEARGDDGSLAPQRIVPDGMAWLESKRSRFAFCLEADRGTMTVGRVRSKFERYRQAQASGAMRKHFAAERFRVLVTAPTQRRLDSLAEAALEAGSRNVWLTTEEALDGDPVRGAVWQRPGKSGRFPLLRPEQMGTGGGKPRCTRLPSRTTDPKGGSNDEPFKARYDP